MKKRLRKKKKFGEFAEYGVLVQAPLLIENEMGLDSFLDDFISVVESCNCYCGGGVSLERGLDMVLELGRGKEESSKSLGCILAWLNAEPRVGKVYSSPLFDLWHGKDPQDLQETSLQGRVKPKGNSQIGPQLL